MSELTEFDRRPIMLSEEELLTLIKASRHDTPLDVAFGGKLLAVPSNEWAFRMVEDMRRKPDAQG